MSVANLTPSQLNSLIEDTDPADYSHLSRLPELLLVRVRESNEDQVKTRLVPLWLPSDAFERAPESIAVYVVPGVKPEPKDPVYISINNPNHGMVTNVLEDGEIELRDYEFFELLRDGVWFIQIKESVLDVMRDDEGYE
jgi:hypothetical protein